MAVKTRAVSLVVEDDLWLRERTINISHYLRKKIKEDRDKE